MRVRIRPWHTCPISAAARRAYNKAWEVANPDKLRVTWRNKRAKRKAAEGRHTTADVATILRLQRGRCAYCKVSIRVAYHVDHIKPLARKGTNWPRNLQALCANCNVRKNATDPIKFARKLGLLL